MAPGMGFCLNSKDSIRMNQPIVQSSGGITLVGGGPVPARLFQKSIKRAPVIVAADSGADRCLAQGVIPVAVIGDMDSLSDAAQATVGADRLHRIEEQETTDFDKALRSVQAPFVLALGFLGARIDHELAVLNALVRSPAACVLLGTDDALFHVPPRFEVQLRRGDRFSLFPMAPLTGESEGLDWPLDGLHLTPGGRIGTSNRVTDGRVRLHLSGEGMLGIVDRRRLEAVLQALACPGDGSAGASGGR